MAEHEITGSDEIVTAWSGLYWMHWPSFIFDRDVSTTAVRETGPETRCQV